MSDMRISPAPTAEEAAAIVAAVDAAWPRALTVVQPAQRSSQAWRFSGRWWHRDRMSRADRPWS